MIGIPLSFDDEHIVHRRSPDSNMLPDQTNLVDPNECWSVKLVWFTLITMSIHWEQNEFYTNQTTQICWNLNRKICLRIRNENKFDGNLNWFHFNRDIKKNIL